jgi:GxxExxY protein
MNTDISPSEVRFSGKHAALTDAIIGAFFDVYNELGYGFLESVYHNAMKVALQHKGLKVAMEHPVSVYFRQVNVGDFRADIIVDDLILLEFKTAATLDRIHEAQVLHDLHATRFEVALLFNFGPKAQFKRFILDNNQKAPHCHPASAFISK